MNAQGNIDEQSLALRLQKGESGAMRDFYIQYSRIITAICARYMSGDDDIKDAVQDTLVNIFSKIDRYQYRGNGSLKAWATRIAVNTSIDTLRKSRHIATVPLDNESHDQDSPPDSVDVAGIPPSVIHKAISQLPYGYRTVFNLYAIDHRSHREIAEMLGIKEASSASQYLRAKRMLARLLNEYINNNALRQ